jgi:menaquinone-dependent protoporphyrinogen oxidase
MSDKILVAYATAAGSTGEVAEAVGQVLRDENTAVDVRRAKDVTDVSPYRAVVVGTAVRAGRAYQEAVAFVERYQQALSQVPVAYFVVCMTMQEDTEEKRAEASAYLDQLREKAPAVEPVDKGLFGGVMDYSKLPLLLRLIVKAMKKQEGDFRNWEAIRTWAMNLRPTLLGA